MLGTKPKQCPDCRRSFDGRRALQQHRNTVHATQGTSRLSKNLQLVRSGPVRDSLPRINYDGSAFAPGQADIERRFGSSAVEKIGNTRGNNGIQEAVSMVIGSTPEGRAWALAALHPCGAGEVVSPTVGVVNGMCDTMTSSVATPVYRSENHLSYSQNIFNSPITAATTYGIDIIVPPIPEIDFMYRLIDDSTDQKSAWIVVRLPDFQLPTPPAYSQDPADTSTPKHGYTDQVKLTTMASIGYGKIRQIAVGHTFELDAAGLNDQGRVIVGQMEGQWRQMPLNAPALTVGTRNFMTTDAAPDNVGPAVTSVEALAPESTSNVWFLDIPTDPGIITSSCPNAYQGLAKHGAYVVSKFTSPLLGYAFKRTGAETSFRTEYRGPPPEGQPGPTTYDRPQPPYLPVSAFAIDTNLETGTLATADSFWNKDPESKNWSAFGDDSLPVNAGVNTRDTSLAQSALHPGITEPSDMMTAVVMFRNLPAGGTSGITSSVRVKSRNYYESIANGINPAVAPYIHPPAQFDFQALNSVIVAGKQLSDAYPASANSLSTILAKVWGALRTYIKPMAGAIGGLDLPIASGVARLIEQGIATGENVQYRFNTGRPPRN